MFFSSKKPYAKRPDRTSEGGDGVVTKQRAHRQMQSVIRTIITVRTSYLNFSEITFSDNHGVIKEKPTWRRGLIDDCSVNQVKDLLMCTKQHQFMIPLTQTK